MKMVSAASPGKCILFGEHSVVYGYPAIAMAISLKSTCTIESISDDKIIFIFQSFNEYFEFSNLEDLTSNFPSHYKQISYCLNTIYEKFKISLERIKITISSLLFPSSGLGSSASIAVALVAAMNKFYNLNMNKQIISDLAFEMEKIIHGTPSGIDNTICTYGNLIFYEKGEFKFLTVPNDLKILVSYTNIEHNTRKAIENVKEFKKENPKLSQKLFEKIGFIANNAEEELKNGNLTEIGKLMNENQKHLTTLGVSNENISKIIDIALDNGAFGSKLTGAGLGGCVITLGNVNALKNISQILDKRGYQSFLTNIDQEGVKVD